MAKCKRCGSRDVYWLDIVDETETELIWEVRCVRCYQKFNVSESKVVM